MKLEAYTLWIVAAIGIALLLAAHEPHEPDAAPIVREIRP